MERGRERGAAEPSAPPGHPGAGSAPETARTPPARPPIALAAGQTIDRYVIQERIGAGGMGAVYRAHDTELDRQVALKLMHGDGAAPDVERVRVLREAQALARLAHPNVVVVHDVGSWQGQTFLTMELVAGPTVRAWSAAAARTWREIVEVYAAAGRGLAAAHAAGLVHRDFKPDNVLVGLDRRVRVTDFGLARDLRRDDLAADGSTGAGTLPYMAPELRRGERADACSDQYAFCVSLHEGLYGARPDQPEPSPPRPVPPWLRRLVRQGLADAAAARHPSMDALLDALDDGLAAHARREASEAHAARAAGWLLEVQSAAAVPEAADVPRLRAAIAEGRAGYREALRVWPDNPGAAAGLRACLRAAAELELVLANAPAARALLDELGEPDPAIEARVLRLETSARQTAARAARLVALEHELDERVGVRPRLLVVAFIALFAIGAAASFFSRVPSPGDLFALAAGCTAVLLLAALILRERLLVNEVNRRFAAAILGAGLAIVVNRFVGWREGTPVAAIVQSDLLINATVATVLGCSGVRAFLAVVPLELAGVALLGFRPTRVTEAFTLPQLAAAALLIVAWRRPATGEAAPRPGAAGGA